MASAPSSSSSSSYQYAVQVPFRILVPNSLLRSCNADTKCFVVGSCRQIGAWNLEKSLALHTIQQQQQLQQGDDCQLFGRDVQIPLREAEIDYRYFLASCHNPNDEDSEVTLSIWWWESHLRPRRLSLMDCLTEVVRPELDVHVLGYQQQQQQQPQLKQEQLKQEQQQQQRQQQQQHLQRGWLTGQTQVHLHLRPSCIEWYRSNYMRRERAVMIACYAYAVGEDSASASRAATDGMADLDDSLSGFADAVARQPAMVCCMEEEEACELRRQPNDGVLVTSNSYCIFQLDTLDLEATAFQFDFIDPGTKQVIGCATQMPLKSIEYKGVKIVQVASARGGGSASLLGTLKVNYLIINSIAPHLRNDMERSFRKHWKKRPTMNIGHRGSGTSTNRMNSMRENTIHSMNVAAEHGADFVELDVQFSKDKVPVVFHDFNVAVTMRLKNKKLRQIEVPVNNFTVHSLQSMKLCAPAEMSHDELSLEAEEESDCFQCDVQPFPSLQQCLVQVSSKTGFLIELKYPQKLRGSTLEGNVEHYAERNAFVNRVLKDVIEFGDKRRIILCTFDPDCCTMLQLKQNRYPVLFLTQGKSQVYPAYEDSRCCSTVQSMQHALSLGVLGLSANVEELLREEALVQRVQDKGLVLFVWGEGLNDFEVKGRFRDLAVDAIIYDYIHTERAKGSLSVFMQETAESSDKSRSSSSSPSRPNSSSDTAASTSAASFLSAPAEASSDNCDFNRS